MSEEERNLVTPEETSPSELPAPEPPEEVLSEKLADTAEEITSGLQDLLPEQPPVEAPAVDGQPVEPLIEPAVEEVQAVPPAQEPEPVETQRAEKPAPEPSALVEGLKGTTGATMESTSDDRLLSMLAWLTMVVLQLPIVSIIQLLSANTKDRPFQRHHAVTSLLFYVAGVIYEILAGIVYAILGTVTLGCGFACLWIIFLVPHALALYYALQAYNGKLLELPFLSKFGRQQGWL